jgi:hypothetical protein
MGAVGNKDYPNASQQIRKERKKQQRSGMIRCNEEMMKGNIQNIRLRFLHRSSEVLVVNVPSLNIKWAVNKGHLSHVTAGQRDRSERKFTFRCTFFPCSIKSPA